MKNNDISILSFLSLDEEGYIEEYKYMKTMQLNDLPLLGDNITSFYDEEKKLYGFLPYGEDGKKFLIENHSLIEIKPEDIRQKMIHLLIEYIQYIEHCPSINLHQCRNDSPLDKSHFNTIKTALEAALSININSIEPINFSVIQYQKFHNELIQHAYFDTNPMSRMVHSMLRGVNTLLAIEYFIPVSLSNKLFATYTNDNTEEEHLDYSLAVKSIDKLESYLGNNLILETKKIKIK